MWKIQTLNKIDGVIHDYLPAADYQIGNEESAPAAIIVRSAKMHDYDFAANPDLLAIARAGAGTNNIPADLCCANGVVVFNTPGANSNAVAELAIGSMIAASRNLIDGVNWVTATAPASEDIAAAVEKGKSQFVGKEILGKTLGVIGLGAIGYKVANKAAALGMQVLGYDPFLSPDNAWAINPAVCRVTSLAELLPRCDFISLHLPVNDQTRNLFNAEVFAAAKEGVILLNFARADLVAFDALAAAIACGTVKKYITDFPTAQTATADGVIAVPHLGASSPESEYNCAVMAAVQIKDFLTNGNIVNSVNFPACSLARSGAARLTVAYTAAENTLNELLQVVGQPLATATAVRGNLGYAIFDFAAAPATAKLAALPCVLKIRSL